MSNPATTIAAITPALIEWRADAQGLQVPYSPTFGDVYFSRHNGLAEAEHVFLAGNQLAERLANLTGHNTFTIGELGFGTGLNVLAVWRLWHDLRKQHNSLADTWLHIVTTEKHPLQKDDLARALADWSELKPFAAQLLASYPPLLAGCHRLQFFDDHLTLDLWLGDAADNLAKVQAAAPVNAWFLDGFAPSCNASLWADAVLDQIQRLSGTGTTAATFSVAGTIKRGLSARGFTIAKTQGFGRKREMLSAALSQPKNYAIAQKTIPTQKHIAIIGAGVAGLCAAYAFAKRGHRVTLIDQTSPLAGGSGNPRALLAPKLTPIHHVTEHLHSISYLYATRFYAALNAYSPQPIYSKTGVLDLLTQSNVSPKQIDEYPRDFACMENAANASLQAQTTLPKCMHLPDAGLVNTKALADAILNHEHIIFKQYYINTVKKDEVDNGVVVQGDNITLTADAAVICTAQNCHLLHNALAKPRTTRGQVSWFEYNHNDKSINTIPLPKIPLKYGGYCAPFSRQGTDVFLIGATFVRSRMVNNKNINVSTEEHQQNLDKLKNALPQLSKLEVENSWQGRVSFRAQMPDYLPLIGQIDTNIYSMAALGSKGFAYAPLCADMLANMLLGEPLPLPSGLLSRLNPLRFNK